MKTKRSFEFCVLKALDIIICLLIELMRKTGTPNEYYKEIEKWRTHIDHFNEVVPNDGIFK